MKKYLRLFTILGLVAWSMAGQAQNNPAADQAAPAAAPASNDAASAAVTDNNSSGTAAASGETAAAVPAADTAAAAPAASEGAAVAAEPQATPAADSVAAPAPSEQAATPAGDATAVAPASPAADSVAAPVTTTTETAPAAQSPVVVTPDSAAPASAGSVTEQAVPYVPGAEHIAELQAQAQAKAQAVAAEEPASNAGLVAANNTPAAAPAAPEQPATPQAAIIPLVVMDDVPLTDAIKNLARQANLNYMLDPKIGFGQPGPDGKPVPQPSVSIRWENITAEQALLALLNNYSLQLVDDPKTKIYRVTVRDPAAPDPLVTKIIQLKYANPSNVVVSVQSTLSDKRSRVVADVRTSQLVVVATDKELVDVEHLIDRLDTITKQVLIEARLFETSFNPSTTKGINWSGTLQNQHVAFGNNLQVNSPSAAVNNTLSQSLPKMLFDTAKGFNPATAFLDMDGVSAVFSFLNASAEAKVISAPRTVTLDNEPARLEVVRASPIINITPGTVQVSGGSQITYTNLGIILNVTPRISANNYVNLKVQPEVSRVFDTITRSVGVAGVFQADEYDIRKMDTKVMIPSGNTLVLGGLVSDDIRDSSTKVPVFGDIPLLGRAFRSDSKSRQKANLIIFITPTIVQENDYQPTKSDFLQTPVMTSDSVGPEWSAWDTGKPMDWSKPVNKSSTTASK